jgi:hypothetical protein
MDVTLLFQQKESKDGYIREMVVWSLGNPVPGCRHLFKFRLYFGTDNGECLVRYDNERGKGDHKHIRGTEFPYIFRTLEATFTDFLADIETFFAGEKTP